MYPPIDLAGARAATSRLSVYTQEVRYSSADSILSPPSIYSDSPAFPHQLSDDDDNAQSHSEEEYENLAALESDPSWGKWPTLPSVLVGSTQPMWASGQRRVSGGRKGSIISISPRGSVDSGRRNSQPRRVSRLGVVDETSRRCSDPALLGSDLPNRRSTRREPLANQVRRRSSVMSYMSAQSQFSARSGTSVSSSQYTDPEEAEHIRKIRSLESLGRRFSEVVEVTHVPGDESSEESEHERDWTPSGSRRDSGSRSIWSPDSEDTETGDDDDDSEVHSLPALPTPVIPIVPRTVLSNFPLASSAVEVSPLASASRSGSTDLLSSSPQPYIPITVPRYPYTPSPPIGPAEILRRTGRGPSTASRPSTFARPSYQRSQSNPLFAGRSDAPQAFKPRWSGKQASKSSASIAPRLDSLRRPSLARSLSEDEGPLVVLPEKSESETEGPKQAIAMSRKGSLAVDVGEFSFLASEISLGEPHVEAPYLFPSNPNTPVQPSRSQVPGSISNLPTFSFHATTPLTSPFTPRFNPMDTFLGKSTPVQASRPLSTSPTSAFFPSTPSSSTSQPSPKKVLSPTLSPPTHAYDYSPSVPMVSRRPYRPVSLEAMTKTMEILDKQAEPKRPRPRSGGLSGSGGLAISHAELPISLGGVRESGSIQPQWAPVYGHGGNLPSDLHGTRYPPTRTVSASATLVRREPSARKPVPQMLSPEMSVSSHGHSPNETNAEQVKRVYEGSCKRCAEKAAIGGESATPSHASRFTDSSDTSHVHYRRHHHRNGEISYSVSTSRQGSGFNSPRETVSPPPTRIVRPGLRAYSSAITLRMPKPIISDGSSPEFSNQGLRVTHARTPSPKRNKRSSKQFSTISGPILVSTTSKVVGTHPVGPNAVHPDFATQTQQRPGMQRSVSSVSTRSTSTFHRLFRTSPTSEGGIWTNKASRGGQRPISTDSSGSDRTLVEVRGIFRKISQSGSPKKVIEEDEEHGMFGPRQTIAPVQDVIV